MDQRADTRSQLTAPRNVRSSFICASDFPLAEVEHPSAFASIVGVDGPSYRPLGATMVLSHDSQVTGSLSSGCIDADIALHAKEAACDGKTRRVRYGAGSPFIDIRLPCGAGLDILVAPAPDDTTLDRISQAFARRRPLDIWIGGGRAWEDHRGRAPRVDELSGRASGDQHLPRQARLRRFWCG